MRVYFFAVASAFLLFSVSGSLQAQNSPAQKPWIARWISYPGAGPQDYGTYLFRKSFQLTDRPAHFVVNISADNLFELYVNNKLVARGPSKGDRFHWKYSVLDIGPYLQAGANQLAVRIHQGGIYRPEAQVTHQTGLIIQGNTDRESAANTGVDWKCWKDESLHPLPVQIVYAYYVAGTGEYVDTYKWQNNWTDLNFNEQQWKTAAAGSAGLPKGVFDWTTDWMLVKDGLPQRKLTPQRLQQVRSVSGITVPDGFPGISTKFEIPANSDITLLLDQGYLTNAYPVVQFSKGRNAQLAMGYAETLYDIDTTIKDWRAQNHKSNRNEISGKFFCGVTDSLILNGRNEQQYSPLLYRTYRYLRLHIITAAEPLILEDLFGLATGYPFERKAGILATDTLNRIFETGWRTASLCAVDTYMDCPYYERLQYIGDTRIQALITLYNTGDERLVRNAIEQLDYSRMAEGITLSRYPTANAQQIPPFSLWWIGMLEDYWRYGKDPDYIRTFLPGMRQVLSFFENYQTRDGSLKNSPYWNFADWVDSTGWSGGTPPISKAGFSAILDLQLLWAYQLAAKLELAEGLPSMGNYYQSHARQLKKIIRNRYYSKRKQLFADTDELLSFSQHANALALITGCFLPAEISVVTKALLEDSTLTQASIYFRYYVDLALRLNGKGDAYINRLGSWTNQLAMGLTTFAEIPDVTHNRSDCHAWSASVNIEFFRTILGIDSDAKGFAKVIIRPHLGNLNQISGTIPHPQGLISVNYHKTERGIWNMQVQLPGMVSGKFLFKGKRLPLHPGANSFNL